MALPNRPNNVPVGRPLAPLQPPELPPGWTEHKAPTGHTYYYNPLTKVSTYTRPTMLPPLLPFVARPHSFPRFNAAPGQQLGSPPPQTAPPGQNQYHLDGTVKGWRYHDVNKANTRPRKQHRPDRPKSKREIPGASPWVLVTTRLKRQFVHNTETKASLWKAPEDVQAAIDAMPPDEEKPKRSTGVKEEETPLAPQDNAASEEQSGSRGRKRSASAVLRIEEEGEKAEVGGTPALEEEDENDEDDEEDEEDDDDEHVQKKLKTEGAPVEFTEEDVAWQLSAMAEEYGLGEEDLEEGEGMAEEDNLYLFKEMLSEYRVNPYSTWDLEMPRIVDDPRYVLINTTKARKEVFTDWCRDRIVELKVEKEKTKKQDPMIPFWAFLKENANTKLYWPEFKRKFKKSPCIKDSKLADKDKEKMYRGYISHMKISEPLRMNDLKKLLNSATTTLSRRTTLETLPESILADVRYVTAPDNLRNQAILEHLATLPDSPTSNPEDDKAREERERIEHALRIRERTVRKEQWKLKGEDQRAREVLKEEEAMIERAKIVGKRGLLGHIIKKEDNEEEGRKGGAPP